MFRRVLEVCLLSVFVSGFVPTASADHVQLKPGFNMFSKQQDIELGKEAAAQVERQMQIVHDQQISSYIQQIGRRLASQPKAGDFPYSFEVVNDPSINAFALPGGPTFVNTGLIRAADNEAQIAGVMAHEISHVALRHGTNQASKANLIQLPAMLAGSIVGGGSGSLLGQLAQLGIGLGANSVLLKFSRTAETEADLLGTQIMAGAGYNPIEMARFFQKLEAQGGSGVPQFLSDHPNPGNRERQIQEEIATLPRHNYSEGNSAQFQQVKARVGGLPAPSRATSNADRSTLEPPSGRLREYRGSAFSISYPENWQSFGQEGSGMVTLAPRQGIVQSGNGSAIGMGTVISYYHPRYNDGRVDLERETRDLIAQLQSSNPNMQVESASQKIRVGNQNGLQTVLSSNSPFGETEVDILVTTARPEGLFYTVLIAPQSQYSALRGAFDQMIKSVRFGG